MLSELAGPNRSVIRPGTQALALSSPDNFLQLLTPFFDVAKFHRSSVLLRLQWTFSTADASVKANGPPCAKALPENDGKPIVLQTKLRQQLRFWRQRNWAEKHGKVVLPLPPSGMDPNAVPDGEPEYPGRPQPESAGPGSLAALSFAFFRFLSLA
jgi:hypothetical protein